MNILESIPGVGKGSSINYGKVVEGPSKERGIMASFARCHVGPATAAVIGVSILVSAVMWICSSFSAASTAMKKDNKIASGDQRQRRNNDHSGNRPGRNNRR